jgi:hypothetical protein
LGIFKQPDNSSFPVDVAAPVRIGNTLTVGSNITISGNSNTYSGLLRGGSISTIQLSTSWANFSSINVGPIAGTPVFQLQVGVDRASKPTTNTWTIFSDERIKKFITLADLDVCYSTIKAMPLKYFEWDYGSNNVVEVKDKHSLGFIAQDVEKVFPKAVDTIEEMYGFSNFKTLNTDQLIKMSHGALQKVMERVEALEKEVANLKSRL